MPYYSIKDLIPEDVANDSVFKLDCQFYPDHLLWSEDLWLAIIYGAIVKKAIHYGDDESKTMVGNIAVVIAEERRTGYEEKPCFLIFTLTVAKDHQRQGLALRMLYEASKAIAMRHEVGIDLEATSVDLSLEKGNIAAYNLYKKCGFKAYVYPDSYDDKIYMCQPVADFHHNIELLIPKMQASKPPTYKPQF